MSESTLLHYCPDCAARYGWPYDPEKLAKLTAWQNTCELCGGWDDRRCDSRPVYLLDIPELDGLGAKLFQAAAAERLLAAARKQLKDAWSEYVHAVSETAAKLARRPAIEAIGWKPDVPHLYDPVEKLRAKGEQEINDKKAAWLEAYVGLQLVARLADSKR